MSLVDEHRQSIMYMYAQNTLVTCTGQCLYVDRLCNTKSIYLYLCVCVCVCVYSVHRSTPTITYTYNMSQKSECGTTRVLNHWSPHSACPVHNHSVLGSRKITTHRDGTRLYVPCICTQITGMPIPLRASILAYTDTNNHAETNSSHGYSESLQVERKHVTTSGAKRGTKRKTIREYRQTHTKQKAARTLQVQFANDVHHRGHRRHIYPQLTLYTAALLLMAFSNPSVVWGRSLNMNR
jgi:hypothetical protein